MTTPRSLPIRTEKYAKPTKEANIYPLSPLMSDLARPRLKQLATWIRDELNTLVAREGPDILKPDDVLTLHETFLALRHAESITMSDLRATGIHKAVQDIAGVATRWPGRLCDDCDKIISSWTTKFGPCFDLHPFLYGRGGRLEGVAGAADYSREALLKRWAEQCPEKIHPKRSHRVGSLGFEAGMWWINPLFAHHSGIIGLESCEGGTTYNKHSAYALLLKDNGELEADSHDHFTYRVPQDDKGKFKLTAATTKSRVPIRVLRSHSINSIWGPKAGVRYDGLYRVKGWSVKQAKDADTTEAPWKVGDILYDIQFERDDPVPMDQVIKRPTAAEVDDYSEYKRLRKVHREGRSKAHVIEPEAKPISKAAPPVPPMSPKAMVTRIPEMGLPNASRRSLFHQSHIEDHTHVHFTPRPNAVTPSTNTDVDHVPVALSKSSTLITGATHSARTQSSHRDESHAKEASQTSPASSADSRAHTHSSYGHLDIREVAPWVDLDTPPDLVSSHTQAPHIRDSITTLKSRIRGRGGRTSQASIPGPERIHSTKSGNKNAQHERKRSGELKAGHTEQNPMGPRRDLRKSIFMIGRNPMAKLLDGVEEISDTSEDGPRSARSSSLTAIPTIPMMSPLRRTSSSDGTMRVYAPTPVRLFSQDAPLCMARRNEICEPNSDITHFFRVPAKDISGPKDEHVSDADIFAEARRPPLNSAIPVALSNLVSPARTPIPIASSASARLAERCKQNSRDTGEDFVIAGRLRRMLEGAADGNARIVFRDPFSEASYAQRHTRASSSGVPPEFLA